MKQVNGKCKYKESTMFQNCIEQQKGTVVFSNQKAKNSFFMRITSICLLWPLSILFFLFYQKYFFFKNTVGFLRSIFSRFIRNIFFLSFLRSVCYHEGKAFLPYENNSRRLWDLQNAIWLFSQHPISNI